MSEFKLTLRKDRPATIEERRQMITDLQQWREDVVQLRDLAIDEKNKPIEDACFNILMKHPLYPIET